MVSRDGPMLYPSLGEKIVFEEDNSCNGKLLAQLFENFTFLHSHFIYLFKFWSSHVCNLLILTMLNQNFDFASDCKLCTCRSCVQNTYKRRGN